MMRVTEEFKHLKIPLEAIILATENFADNKCIGRGGFGKVYKGELVLFDTPTLVAIKRLDPKFGQGNPEFWKEIIILSTYEHENIISLLGFCHENGEKILVYKYASKGSLDSYLNNDDLTWVMRLKICIGVARGLAYLHDPSATHQRVLHRDIKSSNILLDENWNAKISDLGLSKFGPANQQYTFLVSDAVGTIGYCDPLYVETGLLTKESDVYSFGVVLFEVLCGRLCIGSKHRPLTGLVRQYYEEDKINEIIHDSLRDDINFRSLQEFTAIAYQCLRREHQERPLMTEVVSKLERALEYQNGYLEEASSTPSGIQELVKEAVRFEEKNYASTTRFKEKNYASTTRFKEKNYASTTSQIWNKLFSPTIITPVVVVSIKKHLDFIVRCSKNAKDMHSRATDLECEFNDMKTRIQLVEANRRLVPSRARLWLTKVEDVKERAIGIQTGRVGCFNISTRYKVGKDSYDILKDINRLMKEKAEIDWPNEMVPLSTSGLFNTNSPLPNLLSTH